MNTKNRSDSAATLITLLVILFIIGVSIWMASSPKKKSPSASYKEKISAKYDIDGDMPNDYYYGFEAGIQYAQEHADKITPEDYKDRLLDAGYDTGYWDGYDDGYSDGVEKKSNKHD